MKSPLEVSTATSRKSLAQAEVAFRQAKANARLASTSAYVLISAAFVAFLMHQQLVALIVVTGAILMVAFATRRSNMLERRLWWHQARNGLVEALEEQVVIDLRDDVSSKVER